MILGIEEGGMSAATCVNAECSQNGVPKPLLCRILPDETVWCGTCQNPCDVNWHEGMTYEIPDSATPASEESLNRLAKIVESLADSVEKVNAKVERLMPPTA